jgi:hypothetical protein
MDEMNGEERVGESDKKKCFYCREFKPASLCRLVDGIFCICSCCIGILESDLDVDLTDMDFLLVGETLTQQDVSGIKKCCKCKMERPSAECHVYDLLGSHICSYCQLQYSSGKGGVCEHNERATKCKECQWLSNCRHGKRISRCKYCGGGSFCSHGRIRSLCVECKLDLK